MNIGMAYLEFGTGKGIARAAYELSTRMAAAGNDVHFHCVHVDRNLYDSKIRFHRVPGWNSFHAHALAAFALLGGFSLRKQQHAVTHSHGNIIGSDVITAHSCHKAGLKIFQEPGNRGVADALRLYVEKKNFAGRRFKKVIAVSQGVKRELEVEYNVSPKDIAVLPNGVDLQRFSPANRWKYRDSYRQALGWHGSDVVAVFVANEFERKGLGILLDALVMVHDLKLLVVGGDEPAPYRQILQRMKLEERVVFTGATNKMEAVYAAGDLFVLPTLYEAFSLATLEAAASGLPIIATKVNGTEELIDQGKNGLFIARDPDDVSCALRLLVSDANLRSAMGASARLTAERYDWETITQRTLDLYKELM